MARDFAIVYTAFHLSVLARETRESMVRRDAKQFSRELSFVSE
jgi:hypothetical protein